MTKPLDKDVIARSMRESADIAKNGTPEQKAGMFRPQQTKLPPAKASKRRA